MHLGLKPLAKRDLGMSDSAVYVEFIPQGQFLKCSAICAKTGTEVSVLGPLMARASLQALAIQKLRAKLGQGSAQGSQMQQPKTGKGRQV